MTIPDSWEVIVQRAQQAAAERARAAAVAAHDLARAAVARAEIAAESARGPSPPTTTPGELVSFAVSAIVIVAVLVLLWVALGRPGAKQWLAHRHGVQMLLLWGVMVLYTFVSCTSAVADDFSRTGARVHTFPMVLVLWLALLIITWRWASARGAATRVR